MTVGWGRRVAGYGRWQVFYPGYPSRSGPIFQWSLKLWNRYYLCLLTQSKHRKAMTTFWRTFHHDGKISPAWRGWRFARHVHPFHYIFYHVWYKDIVYAPAERADTLSLFLLYPCMYVLYVYYSVPAGTWDGGGGKGRARYDNVNIEKLKHWNWKVGWEFPGRKHCNSRSSGKYVAWLRQDARVSSNVSQNLSVGNLKNKNLCCNCRLHSRRHLPNQPSIFFNSRQLRIGW
jgi:hypothetical protein